MAWARPAVLDAARVPSAVNRAMIQIEIIRDMLFLLSFVILLGYAQVRLMLSRPTFHVFGHGVAFAMNLLTVAGR